MKVFKIIVLTILGVAMSSTLIAQNNVGIGTSAPDSSAVLDVTSTTQGFLPPRMTEVERNGIIGPAAGLIVWCTNCGDNGEVQVFNGTEWTNMIGDIAAEGPFAGLQFGSDIDGVFSLDLTGWSVSTSSDGSRLAVGGKEHFGLGNKSGHVQVYDWNGSAWAKVGNDINGHRQGDKSGTSISISDDGSRLAIGAPFHDGPGAGNNTDAGHVRVYDYNGTAWVQLGSDIYGEANGDQSGRSVSISGDGSRLAIGALYNDGTGTDAGHVRVYEWNGSAWVQLGSDIDGEAAGDQSGFYVSFSGDSSRLAIGAPLNDGTGSDAGHVRLYDWNGSAWVQLGSDIDGEATGDWSGYSVSISDDGSRLAVGAIYNDGTASNAGHVRLYDWNGSAWVQLGSDIDGEAAYDLSGYSVSISGDGNLLAVGSPNNDGTGTDAGQVQMFDWNGSAWIQLGSDIDGEATGDWSGFFVYISSDGKRLAVGAPYNDGSGSNAGHVRVFE